MSETPMTEAELDAALARIEASSRSDLERASLAWERGVRAGFLFVFSSFGSALSVFLILTAIVSDGVGAIVFLGLLLLVPLALLSFARTLYEASQWHQYRELAKLDLLESDALTIMTHRSDALIKAHEAEDDADSRDMRRLVIINLLCVFAISVVELMLVLLDGAPRTLIILRYMAWISGGIALFGSVAFWLPDRAAKTLSRRLLDSTVVRERRKVLDRYEVVGALEVARDDDESLRGGLTPSQETTGGLEVVPSPGLEA